MSDLVFFVVGWQSFASYVPGVVRQLTVAHYLQSLIPHESFQGALASLLTGRTSPLASVIALLLISGTSVGLGVLFFSRKELPGHM